MKTKQLTLSQAEKFNHSLKISLQNTGAYVLDIPFSKIVLFTHTKPEVKIWVNKGNIFHNRLEYTLPNCTIYIDSDSSLSIHMR